MIAIVRLEIVLRILFHILNNANIDFLRQEFQCKIYTTLKTFRTTIHVKLVVKKEFINTPIDPEYEIFIVYIASLSSNSFTDIDFHLFYRF